MKQKVYLVLLFIFSFLAFSLSRLPASIAVQAAQGYLPKNVAFGNLTGSIWQGQVSEVRVNKVQIFNVRWQLEPIALLTGNLAGDLTWGNPRASEEMSGKSHFSLSLLDQHASLKDAVLRFEVEQLIGQLNLPLPVNATGRVIFNIDEYQSGKPYCQQIKGDVFSPNIRVEGLTGWFSIGELGADLNCKSGDLAAVVQPDNLLGLQADVNLGKNLQFKVAGNVKPDASLPKEVHDAVKYLGRPDAQGRYPVNL